MFEKLRRFAGKWASGGFDVEEPSNSVVKPWRVFGALVVTLFIIWLAWFGLAKYFYAQDTKEFDIPNPIKAVPADNEYYAQKRKVKPGFWILTTEAMYGSLNKDLAGLTPLESDIQNQNLLKAFKLLFYKPKPFIDGGWFQNSVYSAALEGLKYCRIGFKQTNFRGMVRPNRLKFNFEPDEVPCLQPEDFGGKFPLAAYLHSRDKNIFYLSFTGYLQAYVNNYNDFRDYVYRCEKSSNALANCHLLGIDQDAETLTEEDSEKARKNGTLVPLRLWN